VYSRATPLSEAVRPPCVMSACRRSLPLCTATSDRDLIPAASRLGWIVDIKSEMRTMAQGVVQRQREAAVRRSRARRRARRQQIARKVLRYGVGTAAAVGAAVGATKLGGVEQARARLVRPSQAEPDTRSTHTAGAAANS
jgi:hypothetical protein